MSTPDAAGPAETSPPIAPTPIGSYIAPALDGASLCHLRVWTDSEWEALPESERPARHAHRAGLGWVGLVLVASLN